MQLIGMLDSPYVRRTAISLRLLGIPFEHMPLSVFRDFDRVHAINPLVKVPTLVCDDGLVLVDSTLIIDYAESIANQRLMPAAAEQHRAALRLIGVALAACEKSVQIFYERRRAADHRDAAWTSRIGGQLQSACKLLERELRDDGESAWLFGEKPMQADITIAVAWGFAQLVAADVVLPADYPKLVAFGARAERLPEFQAFPID
ncbi:MAG TPA: glutathione S-transferase family protein [Rhodanobacteraceae bacterium]|nr:glutathione S-transferase family protein [Rhodanobacteraceae bacterium]